MLQTLNVFTLMFCTGHTKSEPCGFQTNMFFIWKKRLKIINKKINKIKNRYAVLVGLQNLVKNVVYIHYIAKGIGSPPSNEQV